MFPLGPAWLAGGGCSGRACAGGTTAAGQVGKSEPDGYTLLLNTIATHGIGPHVYANLPYDPVKDFSPVILIAKLPLIMAVKAELPARSVNDVIALAKAKPAELSFSSAGSGGAPHLAGGDQAGMTTVRTTTCASFPSRSRWWTAQSRRG